MVEPRLSVREGRVYGDEGAGGVARAEVGHHAAVADDSPFAQPFFAEDVAEAVHAVVQVYDGLDHDAASELYLSALFRDFYFRYSFLRILEYNGVVAAQRVVWRDEHAARVEAAVRHALDDYVHVGAVVDVLVREHHYVGGGDFERGTRRADVREASGAGVYDALHAAVAEPEAACASELPYHREASAARAEIFYKVLRIFKLFSRLHRTPHHLYFPPSVTSSSLLAA